MIEQGNSKGGSQLQVHPIDVLAYDPNPEGAVAMIKLPSQYLVGGQVFRMVEAPGEMIKLREHACLLAGGHNRARWKQGFCIRRQETVYTPVVWERWVPMEVGGRWEEMEDWKE